MLRFLKGLSKRRLLFCSDPFRGNFRVERILAPAVGSFQFLQPDRTLVKARAVFLHLGYASVGSHGCQVMNWKISVLTKPVMSLTASQSISQNPSYGPASLTKLLCQSSAYFQ
jgi:hypothetical protein